MFGEELSKVPAIVYSEAVRTLTELLDKHGRRCAHAVTNSSRFVDTNGCRPVPPIRGVSDPERSP